ncbi:unnamed protein product [Hermetia illucens]|uniref:Histone-lysine N-methyltransferase set-23 n=1 Tax=Hermetia illucens TaxID=343691 RepID=A0A7R8UNK5_HERIL|nr:probable histone-lysine N-methyltransferase set-23 [Hermetia illucens]XP_037910373.1 probable histone-lysine N-methyltransferase set-23 [Hermetia illucens]CAD7084126.1 unnamed protein product [Hermetia illucens]
MLSSHADQAIDVFQRGSACYVNDLIVIDIADDYEHADSSVEYALENVLYKPSKPDEDEDFETLQELFNSIYTQNCSCTDSLCDSPRVCSHGGNYKILITSSGQKQLVLNSNRPCQDLIYECSENCNCSPTCCNRLVQYGPRKGLEIIDITLNNMEQKGLITTRTIPKGAFICEYAGEVLTKSEAARRLSRNKVNNRMNYIICLNETPTESGQDRLQTFIDPTEKGNIGRYLNHSCDPNCEILSVRVGGPIPRLGIFAKKDIASLDELTFHYGGGRRESQENQNDRIFCCCGSANCEKYLPNFDF